MNPPNRGAIYRVSRSGNVFGEYDIDRIVETYESPSFGFASRNFYAEFLAAARSFTALQRHGKVPEGKPLAATENIILPRAMSLEDFAQNTGIKPEELAPYNACLLPPAFRPGSSHQLPRGFQLQIPMHLSQQAKQIIKIQTKTRYARR